MKVNAFVPLKLNNERLPGKNTRLLGGTVPLFHLILETLKAVGEISEIHVFCSKTSIGDLPEGVTYLKRDDALDTSSTSIIEVMKSYREACPADIYVLAHATAPFLGAQSVSKAIRSVLYEGYDSAFSVVAQQDFLWDSSSPMNFNLDHVPRTQDLPLNYRETTGLYVYTSEVLESGRRVGNRAKMVEVSKVEAVDVNDSEDWEIAEAIFDSRQAQALKSSWQRSR